jgi:hypothetical protein
MIASNDDKHEFLLSLLAASLATRVAVHRSDGARAAKLAAPLSVITDNSETARRRGKSPR